MDQFGISASVVSSSPNLKTIPQRVELLTDRKAMKAELAKLY